MTASIFNDKTVTPNNSMITTGIADTYTMWEELYSYVKITYSNITEEWKYYGKTSGWCLKLVNKKRNLLFFIPLKGYFRIRIVLSEKAVTHPEINELSNEIKKAIHTATPYIEGRSIDIDISQREQIEAIKNLLKIKLEN
ncbi:MAG: DUF3788 domain-containing protein [Nitrososphaerota archaeon]|jgi:hypothetical protein|nr:DUF3788 domain-containing protein [Nitrososphaerota archaeon]